MTDATTRPVGRIELLDGPVGVVSPHLDDGVLGCGQLLAHRPGSTVITALAGRPPRYDGLTAWDERCGFKLGEDVVARRRDEDRAALATLGARPLWLDFCESQYAPVPSADVLADALESALLEIGFAAVLIPLGLFHSDHELTHLAGVQVMRRRPELAWYAYEEPIYRRVPGRLAGRLRAVEEAGIVARPAAAPSDDGVVLKRQAVERYGSQYGALVASWPADHQDVFGPERFWHLVSLRTAAPQARRSRRS